MIASRLSRVESMRVWNQISHSDTLHIRPELVKGLYNVYTGILETHQTPEILEDAVHRVLSRLLQRCRSLKGIITINQLTPPPGLQPRATLWLRQPSTRLRSLLCLTMGLILPTLRRSQVLNLRMLMVTVILNFKKLGLDGLRVLFGHHFLEHTYRIYFCFCMPNIFYLYISS